MALALRKGRPEPAGRLISHAAAWRSSAGNSHSTVLRSTILRGFRDLNWSGACWLVPRSGRLECHAPVQLAVGTILKLSRAAEVKVRMPRLTDRPTAVVLLKVEQFLWAFRLLGFGLRLRCHGSPRSVESLSERRWEFFARITSPVWGSAARTVYNCAGIATPRGHELGSRYSRLACQRAFHGKPLGSAMWRRSGRAAVRRLLAPALCRTQGWPSGSRCAPGR